MFLLLSFLDVNAQIRPEAYNFNYLTTDQGLSQNMVDYIYKDSRGFMWFATWNGLNRYDGYQFDHYTTQSEPNAINSLFVHVLLEDRYNYLWVGTEEGINRINIYTGDVEDSETYPFAGHPVFKDPVYSFLEDQAGRIWIGSTGGLTLIRLNQTGEIASIDIPQNNIGNDVTALWEDRSGQIWVGYRSGLVRIVETTDKNEFRLAKAPGTLADAHIGEVFAIKDDEDYTWIGTYAELIRYHKATATHTHYLHDPNDPNSIIQNCVKDLFITKNGDLLIATLLGLCSYDRQTGHFFPVAQETGANTTLNNNFINCLYQDDYGTVWIGTEKGGVNKMIPKQVMFTQINHRPSDPGSLSVGAANSIYEDSRGTLWIGTVEGGLNKQDKQSGHFTHFRNDRYDAHSLSHNTVSYITEGGGYLWIGTWGQSLNRMSLNREGHFDRAEDLLDEGAFISPLVSWIIYDEVLEALWIGSHVGLEFYDIRKRKTTPVLQDMEYGKRIKEVFGLCLDNKRHLWVGTGFGLYCLDLNASDIANGIVEAERYNILPAGAKGSVNEKINCIFETKNGEIWVGTYGYGLAHMEYDADGKPFFQLYNTDFGLSNNVIYGIQEDDEGNLWISSDSGLSCFSPVKKKSMNFYASDGFSTNQFYWVASCRRRSGEIFFGNLNGVVSFHPQVTENNQNEGKVSIVKATLYNQKVSPDILKEGWRLREKDKSFGLEFSALSYIAPEKIRYAYILDGFSQEWTEVDANRRFANYTNLPAGKYIFKVKCTRPDGEWSEHIAELPIRVIPPFYKEKWFMFCCFAFIVLLVYFFSGKRMRDLQKQKIRLEKNVAERTEKIERQKERLAAQASDLEKTLHQLMVHQEEISEQNKQLLEQNDKITRQKEQLEVLSKQLNQATQDKINFFTNIGHEFKTPITLIQGPIEQALKLSQNPKVVDQLNLVHRNSKYLLSLVNQLMDFRKAEEGALKINKKPGNLEEFATTILQPFQVAIKPRQITLKEFYRIQPRILNFDPEMLQRLLSNLLSNAGKFTPDGGKITTYITTVSRNPEEGNWLYISVNDTGIGIPEKYKEKIFERFFQADNKMIYPMQGQSGTGIGLSLCKQIVEIFNGRIWVEDNPGGGTSFRVLLPILPEDLTADTAEAYQMPEMDYAEETYEEYEDTTGGTKPRLLIVEDNVDMRIYIRSILEEKFDILEAPHGESGLQKALKFLPDFIISDVMMPVMDGLEFCKKIKNNFSTSHIPVLLLTAKSSTPVRIEGYKVGADGYIAKPFDADLLIARIENIMELRHRLHNDFSNNMDVKRLEMEERSPDKVFLENLMNVLKNNYQHTDFDVSMLMTEMNMSKSLLHSKLQSLTGQSAVKIIRSYRLNKAKELLEIGEGLTMNISEIAYEVGFNDPKYFTRCFTKFFGIAPSQFNKK
ncbi:two-component regulator propeller domain-containing protein [Parabacteroides sp. PF5-6]|uniref:two-component regulator propeller domain-containing protein n=1 Tax=Parabacteroides sp. PF5-6 TaxID=1742403 RepID=UPI00240594E0|nr:two-component regulator propeller domain-containing protein [Parabacteroides sp. PF5-6]